MAVILRPNSSIGLDATLTLDAGNVASYNGGSTWRDISQNRSNNATLSNTTFTSEYGGSLIFNGSSSAAVIPYSPSWNFNLGQTIMIAHRPTENDGARRNPYNQAYGGAGTWTHEPSGEINYFFGNSGVDGGSYIGFGTGFTIAQNEWSISATTRNTTTAYWYKNGVLRGTVNHSYNPVVTGTNNITIGAGYAGVYLGYINFAAVWNRELSPTEILTYYNTLKSRFGLS